MEIANKFLHFFLDNFPPINLIIWLFPVSILWSFMALYIAGFLKIKWHWKTGYTRKVFHFLIFISAFLFQYYFQLQGVFILGWSVTISVLYACLKGNNNLFYESLAREKDAPFRTKYILYSYIATFFGGVIANLLFGKLAVIGYLITGIADAVAEPIGTRYGKHQYRAFSFDKSKKSHKSLEGSFAVFVTSFLIYFIAINFISTIFLETYFIVFFCALICTIVEAFSPSGFDNMLLQIVGSFLFSLILFYC